MDQCPQDVGRRNVDVMNEAELDEAQIRGAIHPIVANEIANLIPLTPTPVGGANLELHPTFDAGTVSCLNEEQELIKTAFERLQAVASSTAFKNAVLASRFTETNNLTSEQIYNLVVEKSPLSVDFTMFTGSLRQNHLWHTMGYEDENHPTVCFANRHFIRDPNTCASLILHESMHILGFRHDGNKSTSVPYSMNRIFESLSGA
jgi:hypothetical protein